MARVAPPAGLLAALLIAGGVAFQAIVRAPDPAVDPPLPNGLASAVGTLVAVPLGDVERLLGADRVFFYEARDETGAERAGVFVAYYRGRKSLAEPHAPEVCYRANGWSLRALDGARDVAARAFVAEKGEHQRIVAYWYETRGGAFFDAWRLKLDLVRASFAQRPTDALLVRLSAPRRSGFSDEDDLRDLLRFADSLRPPLRGALASPPTDIVR